MAAKSYFPITYKVDLVGDVFRVASVVWAVVAIALFLVLAIIYFGTMREMSGASRLYGNVYVSDRVGSPAVYGIFRPKIVLPASMAESEDLDFVLLHERRHIRRLDNLWRVIAFLCVAVHWFNPLAWVSLRCFLLDLEVACDESVLQKCGEDKRKAYASALVSCEEQKAYFISSFGGAKIRMRVERILSFRKLTFVSVAGFAAPVVAIGYFLLTNAV